MKNILQELREEAGFSLQQLADMCGITKNAIHRLEHEKNNPKLTTAYALAKIFDKSVYEIFPDDTRITEETVVIRKVIRD